MWCTYYYTTTSTAIIYIPINYMILVSSCNQFMKGTKTPVIPLKNDYFNAILLPNWPIRSKRFILPYSAWNILLSVIYETYWSAAMPKGM